VAVRAFVFRARGGGLGLHRSCARPAVEQVLLRLVDMRTGGLVVLLVVLFCCSALVVAAPARPAADGGSRVEETQEPTPARTKKPKKPRKPRRTRRPRQTPTPHATPRTNTLLEPVGSAPLPGRGLALAWAPDGAALAAGGHFKEKATGQRYDTRLIDVAARALLPKSFDCHFWWVVAVTWRDNPFVGEVIIDGGGDHAVKVWDAHGSGSTTCRPGQLRAEDGGITALQDINGWIMDLDVSPDGRWLAGVSRDRTVRIWQLAPGPHQWRVVRLWYQPRAKNLLAVRWAPDGTRLATGDRAGQIAEWSFDATVDLWDEATIEAFARVGWKRHPAWFKAHAEVTTRAPLWTDDGHGQVWNVRYAPDGTRVAGVGTDGVLSVLAAGSGAVVYRTTGVDGTALHGLDWSPDGAVLAAGGADRRVHLFDATDGTLLDVLAGHAEKVVSAVAWSPDGRTLASTAGGPRLQYALNDSVAGPDDAVRFWVWR
jgi:WD40 repeat protein